MYLHSFQRQIKVRDGQLLLVMYMQLSSPSIQIHIVALPVIGCLGSALYRLEIRETHVGEMNGGVD